METESPVQPYTILIPNVDPKLIGDGFSVPQVHDPAFFDDSRVVDLDQREAAERKMTAANATAVGILAAAGAIAHQIDPAILYSDVWANAVAVPAALVGMLPIGGLVRNVLKFRKLRGEREALHPYNVG